MKTKLTPWYPPEIKPVREGVYEVKSVRRPDFTLFSYWTGQNWLCAAFSKIKASEAEHNSIYPKKTWRGLTEKS